VSLLSFLTLTYTHAPTHILVNLQTIFIHNLLVYKAMYISYFIFHDTGEDEFHSVTHYKGPEGE
jgi:hypothetical protein